MQFHRELIALISPLVFERNNDARSVPDDGGVCGVLEAIMKRGLVVHCSCHNRVRLHAEVLEVHLTQNGTDAVHVECRTECGYLDMTSRFKNEDQKTKTTT